VILLLPFLLPKSIMGGEPVGRYIAFRRFNVDGAAYGGLLGPVDDAARFVCLHVNAGLTDGTRLLSAEAISAMQRITATGRKLDVVASNEHSSPRWPSWAPGASYGVAPSRRATSCTWSAGTYRNSASGSTKRLINHGHAMRSTLGRSRVTHFMSLVRNHVDHAG
jgi:hypothetical protein